MSVAVEFAEPAGFLIHAAGNVTFEEAIKAEAALLAHPKLNENAWVLVDGRTVVSVPSTSELRTIARNLRPLRDKGLEHMAVVAGSDFIYGVVRMFGVFAQAFGVEVAPFRDMESAKRWLTEANSASAS